MISGTVRQASQLSCDDGYKTGAFSDILQLRYFLQNHLNGML